MPLAAKPRWESSAYNWWGDGTHKAIRLFTQDTTGLDYSSQKQNNAHGFKNLSSRKGTYVHSTIVTTPERLPLGVWSFDTINRDKLRNQMETEEKRELDRLAYQNKESYRWFYSYEASCNLAGLLSNKSVIFIGDR